jgi:hypothetical protein
MFAKPCLANILQSKIQNPKFKKPGFLGRTANKGDRPENPGC